MPEPKVLILLQRNKGDEPALYEVFEVQALPRCKELADRGKVFQMLVYDHNPCPGRQNMSVLWRWKDGALV